MQSGYQEPPQSADAINIDSSVKVMKTLESLDLGLVPKLDTSTVDGIVFSKLSSFMRITSSRATVDRLKDMGISISVPEDAAEEPFCCA